MLENKLKILLVENKIDEALSIADLIINDNNNLIFILKFYVDNQKIRNYLIKNSSKLLETANNEHIILLNLLKEEAKLSLLYERILVLVKHIAPYTAFYLDVEEMIKQNCLKEFYSLIDKYNKDNDITYLGSGKASSVLRISDYVIKIGSKRDTIDFNDVFYRFIKRYERLVIRGNFFLEVQPYVEHNPDLVTSDMVEELKQDCFDHGYILDDCHRFDCALLKDYKDGEALEKVSKQFIKTPLILTDVDAIRKRT
ncbi:MAG: hypothetical protein RSB71_03195 [Bacilli bacterium]